MYVSDADKTDCNLIWEEIWFIRNVQIKRYRILVGMKFYYAGDAQAVTCDLGKSHVVCPCAVAVASC